MRSTRSWFAISAVLAASLTAASLALAASQGPRHHGRSTRRQQIRRHAERTQRGAGDPFRRDGELTLTVNDDNTLAFELTYANLSSAAQSPTSTSRSRT